MVKIDSPFPHRKQIFFYEPRNQIQNDWDKYLQYLSHANKFIFTKFKTSVAHNPLAGHSTTTLNSISSSY